MAGVLHEGGSSGRAPSRVAVAFTVASVVACGARSRLDDVLGDATGGGGETTHGSTAGPSGGDTSANASSTADAGSSTTSSSPSSSVASDTSSGAGGDGGAAPEPDVLLACVIAASCGDSAGWNPFSASTCLDGFARLGWFFDGPGWFPDRELTDRILECARQPSCEAFRRCYGGEWVDVGRCREGAWCDGDSMLGDASEGPRFDCASLGSACVELWSDAPRACCNAAPCPSTTEVACDGSIARWCGGWGEFVELDCAESGRACNPDPQAPCRGEGVACADDDPIVCDGSIARYCSAGGFAEIDCATTSFRTACDVGAPSSGPACRPAGSACDPRFDLGGCDGDAILVCVDGERLPVSCPEAGFTTCAVDDFGIARCLE